MATYKHLRSSTANKRPTTSIADGQLAINTNTASPGLFFKDSAGTGIVKVGPVHVGTTAPNSSPAGSSGNYVGEQWLDTSVSPAQMKVWNGSTWVGIVADELPVSKLQDGAARQLIQTDAAGTGVEWTSNIDVPGTLDVTSTATFDSIAQHPLGTAGAPTITFSGDTNTGLYSPGADQVAISTNGTGRLFVDASGNVSVKGSGYIFSGAVASLLSTPSFSTRIGGENSDIYIGGGNYTNAKRGRIVLGGGFGDGGGRIEGYLIESQASGSGGNVANTFNISALSSTGIEPILTYNTGKNLLLQTGGTERVRITSDGKLGLGTSSPADILDVRAATATGRFEATGGTTPAYQSYRNSGGSFFVGVDNSTGSNFASLGYSAILWQTGARAIAFGTNNLTRAVIDSSGRVGIGTTAPGTTLTVQQSSNGAIAQFRDASNYDGQLLINADGTFTVNGRNNVRFSRTGSDTESARIDSSGRLLVGTTTTSAAPLTVNGVVEANGSNYRAVFGNGYLDGDSTGATGGSAAEVQIQSASSSRPATLSLGGGQSSGENLGVITFFNSNNTDGKRLRASITAGQEGATANAQGGLLAFSTTADGASSPTERMRISSNGSVRTGNNLIYTGTTGAVTATTGTIVFSFDFVGGSTRFTALVRLSVMHLASTNNITNQAAAEYVFATEAYSTGAVAATSPTAVFEHQYVAATNFAFASTGTTSFTVTLTEPTGTAATGVYYKVDILDNGSSLSLTSVATT